MDALDGALRFRVLVVAEGHHPEFAEKVVPSSGPLEVRLRRRPEKEDPARLLRGRILGPGGQPVVNATVEPYSLHLGTTIHYGVPPGVDPLAVTNGKGEFLLACEKPDGLLRFQVKARGLATSMFGPLRPGGEVQPLELVRGATIKGRVLRGKEPLERVAVRLSHAEPDISKYVVSPQDAVTDREGRFVFLSVTPGLAYEAYGTMESLGKRGTLGPRKVAAVADGSETDLGDLEVGPAFRLAGNVRLSDGRPVPAGVNVLLGHEEFGGSVHRVLEDGRFEIDGLAPGVYRLSVRLSGYRLSPRNRSYDAFSRPRLRGLVGGDVLDLEVLLEPGGEPAPVDPDKLGEAERKKFFADHREKATLPLRGVPE